MHSHSTNTGLAIVVIVTGHAFCVVVPYGRGFCCRDLAITGFAFAIVAGTGIAPVVFIRRLRALALLSLPLRASPLFCQYRIRNTNTGLALVLRALPLLSLP